MGGDNYEQPGVQNASINVISERLNNIMRIVSMLEKALNRLVRQNYFHRNQYPEIVFLVEEGLTTLRAWIQDYKIFACLPGFSLLLGMAIQDIGDMIEQLIGICKPSKGKREVKKDRRIQEQRMLCRSIDSMLAHIAEYLDTSKGNDSLIDIELEKALQKAFEQHCTQRHQRRNKLTLSTRGEKTYIFPCAHKEGYLLLVNDTERFRAEVVEKLAQYPHATGHKPSCKGSRRYCLIGFRRHDRKTIMAGGKEEEIPIRMVQCVICGEKFSLLPSFLPREKHFGIDLIGRVFQNILLFSQSIQAALHNLKIGDRWIKSKQTILNWLRWIGTLHPATILTRAGVRGSGYFQEDEGFEKEPNLRTYSVFMVDPHNLLVWHADYVDQVDEETLCASFEAFARRVTFKILGVTKDKWHASTNALKAVFYRIWIGFCHRHCLKKFRETLLKYQQHTDCSQREVVLLYTKFKKVLETSTSSVSLAVKIKSLDDEAFKHPLLQEQLATVKNNAVYYTSYKKRKGITKTTSIVDNLLKSVKRKLRMVESFRDQFYTRILFQAMANTRNFVPFLSGAKNAHKSPFMLAQGQTYNLPWMQVMNMHNAFLFTSNAF